ncbi:hypothetical protein EON66_00465 [archaeon]|nr:MAG: hypothetical protein EON66_00465 [archaeon]
MASEKRDVHTRSRCCRVHNAREHGTVLQAIKVALLKAEGKLVDKSSAAPPPAAVAATTTSEDRRLQ